MGDVFSIPIDDDGEVGYGQIVATYGSSGGLFYFAVYEGTYRADDEPALHAVVGEPLVLLALSMDALLVHDHWQVVGHAEVDTGQIPWPAYKEDVSPPGTFEVVDSSGQRRRPATDDEAERLPFRTAVAPVRIEKALRALVGNQRWEGGYDALLPVDHDLTARVLLPG